MQEAFNSCSIDNRDREFAYFNLYMSCSISPIPKPACTVAIQIPPKFLGTFATRMLDSPPVALPRPLDRFAANTTQDPQKVKEWSFAIF
jgi:hypothetical protein